MNFNSALSSAKALATRCGFRQITTPAVAGILFIVFSQLETRAAIISAESVSLPDVSAAIALAAAGDTVVIPAGTATWTNKLTISKAITLQGAGVGSTIIKDDVQSGNLILWTLPAGLPSRMTGIEFQDGGRMTTAEAPGGILRVVGTSDVDGSTFRWDYCKWSDMNGYAIFDTVLGVIDHNTFFQSTKHSASYIYDTFWGGKTYGDGAWAAPTAFGTDRFLFFEDNTYTCTDPIYVEAITDALDGARFVFRHNSIVNGYPTNHGTESGGRIRGTRAMEVYSNTFTGMNDSNLVGGSRSGVVVFHDNTISGTWGSFIFGLENFRNFYPFDPWGGADGTNAWDVNDTGGTAGVFFTGTASMNSSGTTVTVSGSPGWSTGQWIGYTVRRTTNLGSLTTVTFGWILSSTSNTLTYSNNCGYAGPSSLAFTSGDTLEIRKVDEALDAPGRAGGSLISGDSPSPPAGWNDQVTEPCYSWNNGGIGFIANSNGGNMHFFNETPMPGYTPYIYPHPLVSEGPEAPQGLHIMP
jgi:hypothetical protein